MSEVSRKRKERGLSGLVTRHRRAHRQRVAKELEQLTKAAKIAALIDDAGAGVERSDSLMHIIDETQGAGFSFTAYDYFRDSLCDYFDSARAMACVATVGLRTPDDEDERASSENEFMTQLFCGIKPSKSLAARLATYLKRETAWQKKQNRSETPVISALDNFTEEFNKVPLVRQLLKELCE